ncbi:MAG: protein kinase [Acidobacteriota bacterium]|nr:protein kinase [Acidobacteriota bacterium]
MICPRCTGENPDIQNFCGDCGTPLVDSSSSGDTDENLSETQILPGIELRTGDVFAGRYRVIELLGEGGMGRVYRVLDRKIDEEIALKLIRSEAACNRKALDRFRSELKTARRVIHKNVARVYDLNESGGIPYITMAYVRGENLRSLIRKVGRLDTAQAVPIAVQICRGLGEAHRRGIIHCDLKPQNIMIDGDGKAEIMDFGLARLASSVGLTEKGPAEGTPAYTAPEQIENRAIDHRADIYSLGVLLYEMVTGHPPFKASSAAALARKHLSEAPRDPRKANPDIPAALARIIMICLEKQPERRYRNAGEILTDLEKLVEPGPAPQSRPLFLSKALRPAAGLLVLGVAALLAFQALPIKSLMPSIAVQLDLRGDVEESLRQQMRGLQANTIQKLSSIPRLRVIPWETVADYGNPRRADKTIGKDLGAKYLLRLYPSADEADYRLTANLIDAPKSEILQSFIIVRPKEAYFELEDQIPVLLARALKVDLVEEQLRTIKRGREPKNIEAYNHYLDGMVVYRKDFEEAVSHFEKAIEIDPGYALAYWGLGYTYEAHYNIPGGDKNREVLDRMLQAYRTAFHINPYLPETNLGLGWAMFTEGNNAKAFEHFQRALNLDPESVMVNRDAGAFLRSLGLYDQAVKYLKRAARLDPHDPETLMQIAQCRAYMGRHASALKLMKKALFIGAADLQVLNAYAIQLVMTGHLEEAEMAIQAFERIDPMKRRPFLPSALIAVTRGDREKGMALMNGTGEEHVPALPVTNRWLSPEGTCFYLILGMKDEALLNIEKGIETGFAERGMYLYPYPSLSRNPNFKPLRGDPRFQSILKNQKEFYLKELKKFKKL